MSGWQEPKNGKRIYEITDNSCMVGFEAYLSRQDLERLSVTYSEPYVNLGIHYYRNQLYSSNLVGICRLKTKENQSIFDDDGNELLLKVIPRFQVTVEELLNTIGEDDEFERYLAPQTRSNYHSEKEIEAIDKNEIFYFFEQEKPFEVEDTIFSENSILTVTVFLNLLYFLCKRPLMKRMVKEEENLTGKIKGKIVIEKNMKVNARYSRKDRCYCSYLRCTDDILENQILKAALKKANRFLKEYFEKDRKKDIYYSSKISYCSNVLRHLSDISYSQKAWNTFKFTGCYAYYKPVMKMAQMILKHISIEANGAVFMTGYIMPYAISMEKLFEVYVRAYLKKNGIHSYKSKCKMGIRMDKYDEKIDVFVQEEGLQNPANYISGPIKPDIVLRNSETGEMTVLDVKYKDYSIGNSRNDRLQLLAYSMMMNAAHIGIILPTQTGMGIFSPRRINSMENRVITYHQILLGMAADDTRIADYVKNMTLNKRNISDSGNSICKNLVSEQHEKEIQHKHFEIEEKAERILRKALWERGYRYRKNYDKISGKPQLVLTKYKIAVFCDSEFFHGKDWEALQSDLLKSNCGEYWIQEISKNRKQDDEINKELMFLGWTVIRFWGEEIQKKTEECIKVIEETIFAQRIDSFIEDMSVEDIGNV